MSVFSERLLLLLHTLFSFSTSSSDSSFRTKCEHHLKDEWFNQPLILQCCMETKINLQNKTVSCISLSDNGSTLSFLSTRLIKKFRLSSLGVWRGNVQTLSDTKNVATDFFKLSVQTSSGQPSVLALQTDRLGDYYGVNYKMAMKFSAHFGINPDNILCASSQPIDVLLSLIHI